VATTDLEKENLEAHVELCSERYKSLHNKLSAIDSRLEKHEIVLREVRDAIVKQNDSQQKQMLRWGIAIIGTLATACASLVYMQLSG
jgi:chromosome segregation ATPase